MIEYFKNIYENILTFDLIYIIITSLSLIKCSRKGFILSLLTAAKWLLAYVITLILFPRVKSYIGNVIENEYLLDIALGIGIFVIIIFLILMINRGIGRAVKYSGLGKVDLIFSANTISHIPNLKEVFDAVAIDLSDNGVFVFEDPYIGSVIQNNS